MNPAKKTPASLVRAYVGHRQCFVLGSLSLLFFVSMTGNAQQACRKVTFQSQVKKGETFQKPITPALMFLLKPTSDGWQIEMQTSPASQHDAAEVATPPYQSINPLLLTTGYGMRAQDAVAWNPRNFQFVTKPAQIAEASQDLELEIHKPGPTDFDKGYSANSEKPTKDAEMRLIALAMNSPHGQLRILDASLVPGTADQSAAAATVASHWRTTPHTLVQPAAGTAATPSGSLESLKFEVTLWLPRGLQLAAGLRPVAAACPQ
jgi:hypothetical protein